MGAGPAASNVAAAWLSSYASMRDRSAEYAEIEDQWRSLLRELRGVAEFEILIPDGLLDSFPQRFRPGIRGAGCWPEGSR